LGYAVAVVGFLIALIGGILSWLIVERPVMHFVSRHRHPHDGARRCCSLGRI
jgi:hypothetical protein